MFNRNIWTPTAIILVGNVVWALSQAFVIFLVAATGQLALVGIIALGLSIFAPITLAAGLNLRNQIAIDHENKLDPTTAIIFRAIISLSALAITAILIFAISDHLLSAVIAILIVGTRIADQIADVSSGVYQKNQEYSFVMRSLMIRGVANAVPFAFGYHFTENLLVSAGLSFTATIIAVAWMDVLPIIKKTTFTEKSHLRDLVSGMGRGILSAPFPVLDTLHINSLRYAIVIFLPLEVVGKAAVAQTLYVPAAMTISALGYSNLARASQYVREEKWHGFRRNVWRGVSMSAAVSLCFMLSAFLLPEKVMVLIDPHLTGEGRALLIMIAVAMMPVTVSGFPCQSLISRNLYLSYTLNPLIGLVSFWLILALLVLLSGTVTILTICIAFAISGSTRSIAAIFASLRGTNTKLGSS